MGNEFNDKGNCYDIGDGKKTNSHPASVGGEFNNAGDANAVTGNASQTPKQPSASGPPDAAPSSRNP